MSNANPAQVYRIPAFNDNYIWMLHNPLTKALAVIDPGEAEPVLAALKEHNLTPTEIVNTHHHGDHIGGNEVLRERFDIPVMAPASEESRIANITTPVRHGDRVTIAGYDAEVIETPGHTTGHVAFHLPDCGDGHGVAFVGDTLFSMGCGRVFEGTMAQMWASLSALRALPDQTLICAGHEYSASNAKYVASLNWPRAAANAHMEAIHALRAKDEPTLPVMLKVEKDANPFLNCDADDLQQAMGMAGADPADVFAALRGGKDAF